jgi:hypothetical protein
MEGLNIDDIYPLDRSELEEEIDNQIVSYNPLITIVDYDCYINGVRLLISDLSAKQHLNLVDVIFLHLQDNKNYYKRHPTLVQLFISEGVPCPLLIEDCNEAICDTLRIKKIISVMSNIFDNVEGYVSSNSIVNNDKKRIDPSLYILQCKEKDCEPDYYKYLKLLILNMRQLVVRHITVMSERTGGKSYSSNL